MYVRTPNDPNTFVGFLSFENTLAHAEVVKNLDGMQFLYKKIKVAENTFQTTMEQKIKNRFNFKKNIKNREKILSDNRRYLNELSSKKRKCEDEDENVNVKKTKLYENIQTVDKATQTQNDNDLQKLKDEIQTLKHKVKQLEEENEEFKQREEAAKVLFRLSKK